MSTVETEEIKNDVGEEVLGPHCVYRQRNSPQQKIGTKIDKLIQKKVPGLALALPDINGENKSLRKEVLKPETDGKDRISKRRKCKIKE